jgi:L-cystine uptake protein TcyP (sodium:dicarboxylate symporter family)
MKKLLGILLIAFSLILGFSCNSADKAAKAEAERIKKEIMTNDSIALTMESLVNEIDSSSVKVDKLLKDL